MCPQGKAHRDKQLIYLKDHLDRYYHSRDRKWIVLFPEGGFLRKRRETSQSFAKKNSLPHLSHVTLPRLGATQVILKTLGPQLENGNLGAEAGAPSLSGTHTFTPSQWETAAPNINLELSPHTFHTCSISLKS